MIILLGFPKSGTRSFTSLFENLGTCQNVYHWKKNDVHVGKIINDNKKEKKPLLDGFEENDCLTQLDVCSSEDLNFWPQITDFKKLYSENPTAIFILNKREPEKVFTSFQKWFEYDKRIFKFNPQFFKSLDKKGFIDFVKKHYKSVETFFKSKPKANFISFDIDKDNIQKLNKYINTGNLENLPKVGANKGIQTKDVNYKLMYEYKEKYKEYKHKYLEMKKALEKNKCECKNPGKSQSKSSKKKTFKKLNLKQNVNKISMNESLNKNSN